MSHPAREAAPWYARLLNERGLATLLALVLVGAMLVFGKTLLDDMRSFQSQMVVEAARTNEQLRQLQLNHLEMQAQMDRLERMLLARSGP